MDYTLSKGYTPRGALIPLSKNKLDSTKVFGPRNDSWSCGIYYSRYWPRIWLYTAALRVRLYLRRIPGGNIMSPLWDIPEDPSRMGSSLWSLRAHRRTTRRRMR